MTWFPVKAAALLAVLVALLAGCGPDRDEDAEGPSKADRDAPTDEYAPAGVNKRNYERIKDGMTLAQVEAIIGGKGRRVPRDFGGDSYVWDGPQGSHITVYLSDDGKVSGKRGRFPAKEDR